MLPFIIGVFVGAIISFFVFVICSMAKTDERTEKQYTNDLGDSDVRKQP